jgi:hypothetical protein
MRKRLANVITHTWGTLSTSAGPNAQQQWNVPPSECETDTTRLLATA